MTSMWSLFGQLTHIPTKHTHFFFPLLPPLTLSVQRRGSKDRKGGSVCGICWHRLTRNRESRGRATKRHTQRDQNAGGGNTVAAAVVFHRRLERVGVLLSLGECVVTWSPGHVMQKFMGSFCRQESGKRRGFLSAKFSKHAAWTQFSQPTCQMYFPRKM